jgi:hypothetical protein
VSANFDESASSTRGLGRQGCAPTYPLLVEAKSRPLLRTLAIRAAALFAACLLASFWLEPTQTQPQLQVYATTAVSGGQHDAPPTAALSEQIQELLAKGGCPGWIALAHEPELLTSPAKPQAIVYAGPLQQTAAQQEAPPRVAYPIPLQAPTGDETLRLVALPPVDDDELISEEEDLLHTSPEITGEPAEQPEQHRAQPMRESEPEAKPESARPASRRDYTPRELLRDKPFSSTPADQAPVEDLLEADDDLLAPEAPAPAPGTPSTELLEDRGDLLAPQTVDPLPAPAEATPAATQPAPQAAHVAPPSSPFGPAPANVPPMHGAQSSTGGKRETADLSRCEFTPDTLYPSAAACRACHEKIYDEWSISSHAYAAVSPMFHKFEQTINNLSNGTIGYFCYRCHSPVGTALGVPREAPIYDAPLVAREGVTCVACHRVREMYGKTNGERRIEPGDIYAPVYGSIGGDGVAIAASQKDNFKVKTSPHDRGPGQDMHALGVFMPQLGKSEFCASCHQVAVYPGIKLEVVWEQYRASPACKKGVSCQDCHMGRIPGVPSGYDIGPAAEINKKNVNAHRKHSNHVFYGPGYSIAHPGVFPFNPKADRWSMRDWLLFDWRAGWGTDPFEDAVADGQIRVDFPLVWNEADDRYDAREIIDANLKKKSFKDELRAQVMENGSHVEGPFFKKPAVRGQDLKFDYIVTNANEGHNLPTASLGAQPQLWANVVLIGPQGNRLWESGYLDKLGDLADIHSEEVRHKRIAYDWQLFNLQTMFLITGAKGTDREFYLPINIDIDQLAFIRPAAQPVSVLNHPPFIRMEARSLAPLGVRRVPYKVPGHLLREPGRYRLSFRMRSRTEPLYFMRFCGSTSEMQRAMLEGTLDFHQSSVEFDVR